MTYAEKKAAGLCVRCGKPRDVAEMSSCTACLNRVNENRVKSPPPSAHREGGGTRDINLCCLGVGFHRIDCPTKGRKR